MSLVINLPADVEKKMRESFAYYSKECQVSEETLMQKALEFYLEDLEDVFAERNAILAGEKTIPWEEVKRQNGL